MDDRAVVAWSRLSLILGKLKRNEGAGPTYGPALFASVWVRVLEEWEGVMDSRDETPWDAVPSALQQQQTADLEDRRPGTAELKRETVWLYPICGRMRALRAGAAAGLILAGWLPIVGYLVWGGRAGLGGLVAISAVAGFFYLVFRAGWVEVGTDRLAVQDKMLGPQRFYERGEVSGVILRDGRLSISGDDGVPHTRRLRAREERRLRACLERYYWI